MIQLVEVFAADVDKICVNTYYNTYHIFVLDIGCEMFYWQILTTIMTYMPMYLNKNVYIFNSLEMILYLRFISPYNLFINACSWYSFVISVNARARFCSIFVAIASDSVQLTTSSIALEFYHTLCSI